MRSTALLLAVLVLPSCGGEEEAVPLACEFDPHDWFDNPATLLVETEDGRFDYDPSGIALSRKKGSWDAEKGEISWTDSYTEGYFLAGTEGIGAGTIEADGDLDLYTRANTTDVLGAVWADRYHYVRTGCEGTTSIMDWTVDRDPERGPPAGSVEHLWAVEIVADDEVHAHLETTVEVDEVATPAVLDAVYREDVAMVLETHVGENVFSKSETWQYDGTGVGTWTKEGPAYGLPYHYVGADTYFFDGSYLTDFWSHEVKTQEAMEHWVLLYQYDGSAEGTLWIVVNEREYNCEITIRDDGHCRAVCEGGITVNC